MGLKICITGFIFTDEPFLIQIRSIIGANLKQKGFISENEASNAYFQPHVTLLKISSKNSMLKKSRNELCSCKVPKKLPKNSTAGLENIYMGREKVKRLQLLSLRKNNENSQFPYYFCEKEFDCWIRKHLHGKRKSET